MPLRMPQFANADEPTIALDIVAKTDLGSWRATQSDAALAWIDANGWSAGLGEYCAIPDGNGTVSKVVLGYGDGPARQRNRFGVVKSISALPLGAYEISTKLAEPDAREISLAWMLASYHFDTYKKGGGDFPALIAPTNIDAKTIGAIAAGEALTRDLINTPSSDMGPAELETAAKTLGDAYNGQLEVIRGDALLDENFPMIHAVGRASDRAPRLIDLKFGETGPTLCLVGKGVCFDTGGLNLKPGASMGLMKKDMGGAAHVLGLAKMILQAGWDIQLRVLIPAVENSVSGNAFRPQDVLHSRKGLTVEINNTDAEGRLVLADALALADETPPDVMICMATLTGAARVAVGPDIAPFFSKTPDLAQAIFAGGDNANDPVWQLPFHPAYEKMIEPAIADLDNAPAGGFAGCITAALFLNRFVTSTSQFAHFDCYGWQPAGAPARPKGGVGQGTRALFDALPRVLDL